MYSPFAVTVTSTRFWSVVVRVCVHSATRALVRCWRRRRRPGFSPSQRCSAGLRSRLALCTGAPWNKFGCLGSRQHIAILQHTKAILYSCLEKSPLLSVLISCPQTFGLLVYMHPAYNNKLDINIWILSISVHLIKLHFFPPCLSFLCVSNCKLSGWITVKECDIERKNVLSVYYCLALVTLFRLSVGSQQSAGGFGAAPGLSGGQED